MTPTAMLSDSENNLKPTHEQRENVATPEIFGLKILGWIVLIPLSTLCLSAALFAYGMHFSSHNFIEELFTMEGIVSFTIFATPFILEFWIIYMLIKYRDFTLPNPTTQTT